MQLSLEYARRLVEAILTTLSREKLKGWANCRWGTPMEIQSIGRLSDIVGGSLPFDFLGSSLTKVIACPYSIPTRSLGSFLGEFSLEARCLFSLDMVIY